MSESITRRRLLGAGAAATATLALPGPADARTTGSTPKHTASRRQRKADVVIVGAGFAGLTAARTLVQAGKSVIVLEARDRVGGRVVNHDLGGGHVSERGGTFAGPTQDRVLALAAELGVGTFATYDDGKDVYISGRERLTYGDRGLTGTAPPDPLVLPDLTVVIARLDSMAKQVPVDAPWTAANAAEWDAQTMGSWLDANSITPQFRKLAGLAMRPIFGAEAREVSLLYTLFYIAASGDENHPGTFERNFNTRGGGQQSRFAGGSQVIALKMAKQLGRRVVLRSPVRRIVQKTSGVRVESDRYVVRAKRAIVAIPPTLAGRIDYAPDLPFERDQLTQRYAMGALTKVAAVYDRPFWRGEGLTGQALNTDGFVSATFDDSPPGDGPGVLFGFVGGDRARAFNTKSPGDRRAAVLAEFAAAFGGAASDARDYFETNWSAESWTRGCPVGILGPGVLTAYGSRIREPVGLLHWAGTETSTYWNGYMDGAVRSGQRAAQEVLDNL